MDAEIDDVGFGPVPDVSQRIAVLIELQNQSTVPDGTRDAFWFDDNGRTIFTQTDSDGNTSAVAFLVRTCGKWRTGMCAMDQGIAFPAPNELKAWSCGCKIICAEFPLKTPLNEPVVDPVVVMEIEGKTKEIMWEAARRLKASE